MFKAFVVAFALTVSGFMLWVAHHDAHDATTTSDELQYSGSDGGL